MSDTTAIHTFLPWARRGIAAQIQEIEANPVATERATVQANVYVKVNNSTPPAATLPITFQIIGPGDIIGIHSDAVVKTEPHNWITNFEPHSFPFIDFYEEDFPWRYTPAKATAPGAGGKLRPWITLVVLKEDEFTRTTVEGAPLNAIVLSSQTNPGDRPLPQNDELWAWAHVSVDDKVTNIADLNTKVNAKPNIAVSRIICPRKLEENTSYYAFLIPTYETGRRAGLGLSTANVAAQAPAWDHNPNPSWLTPGPNLLGTFPVYYEWYFRTGATGDFEYLVRQIKPRTLDTRVGQRLMDIQSPGYGLSYSGGTGGTAGTELIEGALRAPGNNAPVFPLGYPQGSPESNFRDQLKDFVNLGEDMLTAASNPMVNPNVNYPSNNGTPLTDDPIVAPPLYGRWHALRSKVNPNDASLNWLNELNLDPRYRVAASLGGDYVRNNQDFLMDQAWDQVGKVLDANRKAQQAQLAMQTAKAMHTKHIEPQSIEQLLPMTGTVHTKINTGTQTLKQDMLNSNLPKGAASSTFRKVSRPTGVLVKRLNSTVTTTPAYNSVARMIQGTIAPVAAQPAPSALATTFPMSAMGNAVANVQGISNAAAVSYNISAPGSGYPPAPANSTVAANFQAALLPYTYVFGAGNWITPVAPPNISTVSNAVADAINPKVNHVISYYETVGYSNQVVNTPIPDTIVPAMAAPAFNLPMYESLRDLGMDYFVPNLNLLPQNSITLFESNQKFIEAFMVGVNYEMGRELLWREYPTDQRGTYFKHFWSSTDSIPQSETDTQDIKPIHEWPSTTALGSQLHSNRPAAVPNNLVLAVRGDLLKKFPNAVIYAVEAQWKTNTGNYWTGDRIATTNPEIILFPIFQAKVNPDITFLGFNITKEQAKGDRSNGGSAGYFFVLMERPGELRFGIDYPDPTTPPANPTNWNELNWNHVNMNPGNNYLQLATTTALTYIANNSNATLNLPVNPVNGNPSPTNWAEDSAAMAMILYQNPFKILIHASEMMP